MKNKKKIEENNIEEDDKLLNEMLYVFKHPREEIAKFKYSSSNDKRKMAKYLRYLKNKKFNVLTKEEKALMNDILKIWDKTKKKRRKTTLARKTLGCYKCKFLYSYSSGGNYECKIMTKESMNNLCNLKLKCRYFEED
uniref:Uncharacterized protein n=1 Tax=viral metagenome TaxID=1070528 RepID=A0A6H1ZIQ0_9ZZZZ